MFTLPHPSLDLEENGVFVLDAQLFEHRQNQFTRATPRGGVVNHHQLVRGIRLDDLVQFVH